MDPIFDGYMCPDDQLGWDQLGWDEAGWDEAGWDEAGWDEAAPWSVPAGTPPCPDGNPQRLLEILGFRMKSPDLLQLRAVLYRGEGGCVPVIDEQPDCVRVRLVACWDPYEVPSHDSLVDVRGTDCPFRIWLDAPLGPRRVIGY